MKIVTPMEFPFVWLRMCRGVQKRGPGNPKTRKKYVYKDIITAFDIETTRLPDIEQSIMYVWQWSFDNEFVVMGRTWDDFLWFISQLEEALDDGVRLCCFVHNLSFEFSFLRGIHEFMPEDVFAVKARRILRAFWGQIEFRCSYLHSNMSLDNYTEKMGVQHVKLSGYDYDKLRYPWTELTEFEVQYCVHDVVGLVEAVKAEMAHDGDTLYTFPLTSTGYVRRDAKAAMAKVSYNFVHEQLPTLEIYEMLREAFRGGDCHANRYFIGQIVDDIDSDDRSSSYPDIVCNCKFPVSPFFREKRPLTVDEVLKLITVRGRAVIMRVAMWGVQLRDAFFPAPYLSKDKCRHVYNATIDNGRILRADYLETTLTDVDLQIVVRDYEAVNMIFYDVCHARYGYLPRPLIDETIKYYRAKTELKGVAGQEVYYVKSKNKLNSIYGMMAQDPCKPELLYLQNGMISQWGDVVYYVESEEKSKSELLEDANKRAFLCYQWGCWVTAWARYRLREGIWNVIAQGAEFLYCDTDSVKYKGVVDWTEFNAKRIADSIASGAYADDPSGQRHYMGVFESEKHAAQFRTWGAKKYAYTVKASRKYKELHPDRDLELIVTVAGVGKTAGAEELIAAGGIKAFHIDFVFHEAGGLEAVYNDEADLELTIDGHQFHITPNVNLRPSTYKLGLAGEFERLLRSYGIVFKDY